ncbi:MAG: hypothetical protein H0T17_02690 [Propionibacteriales bacterium]|nr:hypothetical protein [Propionibacteriales bacterium]
MTKVRLVIAVTIATTGLTACGGDNGGDARPSTIAPAETSAEDTSTSAEETSTSAPVSGDAILIETRITNAKRHTGEVLDLSVIGESAFCRGGESRGSSEGPTITATFHCPGGTLRVQYAPTQPSLVQGALWEVVRGTGSFKGLRGGGSMVAKFERDNPDSGREVFTGTVGE